jgi:hypothetical protein
MSFDEPMSMLLPLQDCAIEIECGVDVIEFLTWAHSPFKFT